MTEGPSIYVPAWCVRESGLIVPSSVAAEARPAPPEVPAELLPPPAPVAIRRHVPSSADFTMAVANEEVLRMAKSSRAELEAMVAQLPFEPAFLAVSRFAAEAWHSHRDAARQLELIRSFGIEELTAACERFLAEGDNNVMLAEQYLTVLQRLLVERAANGAVDDGLSDTQGAVLLRSLFATGTVVSAFDEHLMELDPADDEWLVYLIQNGIYNARSAQMNALTRAHALFVEYHQQLAGHTDWCPLDEWFVEDYGLTVDEQHAAGFALYGVSGGLDDEAVPTGRSLINPPFAEGAMADRQVEIVAALTADRQWYAEQFAAALAEAGGEERSIAWERRPFLRRPFLRMTDGKWLLVSPRAIDSWLGDGFFFRTLTSAQARNLSLQFTRYFGALVQAYALDLVKSVYPGDRPAGGGRVHGELPYGRSGARTSDVIVDLGTDLVVIEVVSARLTNEMQVAGNPEVLERNLERMLFKKMGQLARVIGVVLDGDAEIPDVDPAHVQRVWPVVVSAGNLMHTEHLWAQIDERMPAGLTRAKVEALTALDVEDLEYLCAIIESGQHLPDVLRRKAAGPYRQLEFTRWAQEELGVALNLRPTVVEQRWQRLTERMMDTLGFDPRERGAAAE